jgi:hypothetical protein
MYRLFHISLFIKIAASYSDEKNLIKPFGSEVNMQHLVYVTSGYLQLCIYL